MKEHIEDALSKGASIITGGQPHELGGNFFQPTILVDVPASAKVAKEETFGPLAPLFRFKDEADVVAQANDTEFGLAAYFMRAILAAYSALAKRWSTASWGSTPALFRMKSRLLAGSKPQAWAAKARSMASKIISKSNICASACKEN